MSVAKHPKLVVGDEEAAHVAQGIVGVVFALDHQDLEDLPSKKGAISRICRFMSWWKLCRFTTVLILNLIPCILAHPTQYPQRDADACLFRGPILTLVSSWKGSHDSAMMSRYLPYSDSHSAVTLLPFVTTDTDSRDKTSLQYLARSPRSLETRNGSPPAKFSFFMPACLRSDKPLFASSELNTSDDLAVWLAMSQLLKKIEESRYGSTDKQKPQA